MYQNNRDRRIIQHAFDAAEESILKLDHVMRTRHLPITIRNRVGYTLAHIAARHDNLDVLKYVVAREPSLLDKEDNYGCSILHHAVTRGSLNSIKYLVEEHGADICRLGGQYRDRSAVHVAVEFNHLAVLKYFVEDRKVDFNVPNPSQKTPPIFLTVKNRNWDVIEYLVEEKHADVKLLNFNEENILFPIVRENFFDFLRYLLDQKKFDLDVNWRSYNGETIVHVAASKGRLSVLKYLVDTKQVYIDAEKSTDKRTPLHYAAYHDDIDICEFLIDHGADPRVEDRSGRRAADFARDGRLIRYLEDKVEEKRRRPRSVTSWLPPQEVVAPLRFLTPRTDIGHAASSIVYNAQIKSFSLSSGSNLTFQPILFLASSITRAVRKVPDRNQTAQAFLSPFAVIQSRMSSIAIDAIDNGIDFSKF